MEETEDLRKGICCILLSVVFYAAANTFVRLSGDLPAIQKTFFRSIVAAVFAFLSLIKSGEKLAYEGKDIPLLVLRSAVGMTGLLLSYYAIDHLALSDATILGKTAPFFTILFSALFLKERFMARQGLLVLGAFIGALFVIKPSFSNALLFPSVIGFLGGMATGAAYAAVHALGRRGVPGGKIVLFFTLFTVITAMPLVALTYVPMTIWQLLMLLMVGLFSTGGLFSVAAAYRYAAPGDISIYEYTEIVLSQLIGFFLFSQLPDALSVLGYCVIIAMAFLMFLFNRRDIQKQTRK